MNNLQKKITALLLCLGFLLGLATSSALYAKADFKLLVDEQNQQQEDSSGSQSSEKEDFEELEDEKFTNKNSEPLAINTSSNLKQIFNPDFASGTLPSVPLSPPNS